MFVAHVALNLKKNSFKGINNIKWHFENIWIYNIKYNYRIIK